MLPGQIPRHWLEPWPPNLQLICVSVIPLSQIHICIYWSISIYWARPPRDYSEFSVDLVHKLTLLAGKASSVGWCLHSKCNINATLACLCLIWIGAWCSFSTSYCFICLHLCWDWNWLDFGNVKINPMTPQFSPRGCLPLLLHQLDVPTSLRNQILSYWFLIVTTPVPMSSQNYF